MAETFSRLERNTPIAVLIAVVIVSLATIGILSALLWRKEQQLEAIIGASELARKEQAAAAAKEREALAEHAAKEREQLLQRIQAPEIAAAVAATPEVTGPQYISEDDWEAFARVKEEALKAELNGDS